MSASATVLQRRVLCLDDDESVLELLEAYLPREGPFAVRTTTDPDRGFELVAGDAVDLVVCDYQMDTCSGVDFIERVRANDFDIPVVLFTGHGTDEVIEAAQSAGVTDFVRKGGPDHLDALASSLSAASDSAAR